MKIIETITAYCKKPKVGDQFCDWGLGKSGFSCEEIIEVRKKYIIIKASKYNLKGQLRFVKMNIPIERYYDNLIHTAGTKQKITMVMVIKK